MTVSGSFGPTLLLFFPEMPGSRRQRFFFFLGKMFVLKVGFLSRLCLCRSACTLLQFGISCTFRGRGQGAGVTLLEPNACRHVGSSSKRNHICGVQLRVCSTTSADEFNVRTPVSTRQSARFCGGPGLKWADEAEPLCTATGTVLDRVARPRFLRSTFASVRSAACKLVANYFSRLLPVAI